VNLRKNFHCFLQAVSELMPKVLSCLCMLYYAYLLYERVRACMHARTHTHTHTHTHYTLILTIQLPMGSAVQQMAMKCWCLQFQPEDQSFLIQSNVFANISTVLSSVEEISEEKKAKPSGQEAANKVRTSHIIYIYICHNVLPPHTQDHQTTRTGVRLQAQLLVIIINNT